MEIGLFILIILVASILQTSTGFGFSVIATPFLLLIFQPAETIQIILIYSLIISTVLIKNNSKNIDYGILKRFIAGSIAGMPLGMVIFLLIDTEKLKLIVSVMIIVLTIMLIFRFRIKETKRRDLGVGAISGAFTTSMAMSGPPLLLYFSGTDTEKAKLRDTTLAFFLFIAFFSLIIQLIFAGTNMTTWIASGLGLPLVLIGLFLGQKLFKKINQNAFRIMVYCLLLFTGIYLFIESWTSS